MRPSVFDRRPARHIDELKWLCCELCRDEAARKKYLNDWFTGKWPGSSSRGKLLRKN